MADVDGWAGGHERRVPPLVMGQEASGVVDAVGPRLDGWAAGVRVAVDPFVWCGECERCAEGRINLCQAREELGAATGEVRRDGALAEHLVVPARVVHRLPEGLDLESAALAAPLAMALHAVARAGEVRGRSVVVVGAETNGLLIVQALKRQGAGPVIVIDPAQERLDIACALGADEGCVPAMARSSFAADIVIGASGTVEGVELALAAVHPGGRLVLAGCRVPDLSLPLRWLVANELDCGGACGLAGEMPAALAALAAGEVRARSLVTAVFPLERAAQAFEMARHPAAAKVMVRVGGAG